MRQHTDMDQGDIPSAVAGTPVPLPIKPLRAAQKARTRTRILDAARNCFVERGVTEAQMDEIAIRAAIGRATIYLHYGSKNAILFDLLREDWDRQHAIFARLADAPAIDPATVHDWLRALVKAVRKRGGSMGIYTFILSQDEAVYRELVDQRDRLIATLGRRIAPFRIGDLAGEAEQARRLAAHMMLFQIEQFCAFCARQATPADIEVGTRVLAGNLVAFIDGEASA